MLENITKRLDKLFKKIRGRGLLTEENIDETLREVRLALLESDVHFKVAKKFCEAVRKKAVGKAVLESLTPGQQVVKIVSEELTELMGGQSKGLALADLPPTVVMLVGLQGSGKTTTAGKLALFFKKKDKRVLLVAADLQRPAAVDQLQTLGKSIEVSVVSPDAETNPVAAAEKGIEYGRVHGFDVVILDTAGRIEVDEALMAELSDMKVAVKPDEILLVADAMTGQTAVNVAETFHQKLVLTGVVLTKTEGDARGGAILSIRAVTGAPVRFIGTGEKLDALELFHPDRMASRILGMGDVLSLVELAQEKTDLAEAALLEQKIRKDQFTLDDFSAQLNQMKKMGGAAKLMQMIPGMQRMKAIPDQAKIEREMKSVQAMISSMTRRERREPGIITGSRRKRISRGSGTSVQALNRLLKQFYQAKKMMKRMSSGKRMGMMPGL
ncbi:Signal recognition particle protein Ffh [hydrothermal vent metagenome]|uniref:signal-recognition-particle GTPase n=1 Tax=hydrothermal vent metagenome TaxID=652676 RepID=A0A3B1CVY5_9ZZZZ